MSQEDPEPRLRLVTGQLRIKFGGDPGSLCRHCLIGSGHGGMVQCEPQGFISDGPELKRVPVGMVRNTPGPTRQTSSASPLPRHISPSPWRKSQTSSIVRAGRLWRFCLPGERRRRVRLRAVQPR